VRPAAGRFRQAVKPFLGTVPQQFRVAPGITQEMAGEPFRVVQQSFQQMLGKAILMAPSEGFHLRSLQQGAGALSEICEVQSSALRHVHPPVNGADSINPRPAQCATA
jgi:hypothetical protein